MSTAIVSAIELAQLCSQGRKPDLIDVRTPREFGEFHVAFARNVPLDQLDPARLMQAGNGSAGEPLYLICRSGTRGRQACEQFIKAGFPNVINIEGGTLACVQAGLPVVRGKKAVSLERQVRIAAGLLVLLGAILAWTIHPALLLVSALVGAGLVFAGVTDHCGLALLLAKLPWNRAVPASSCAGKGGKNS